MPKKNRFKRVYVEITNICNLNCSFCSETKRKKGALNVEEFKHIVEQIRPFTDYIYFHVKGEPLLHKNLEDFLKICYETGLKVIITTNGTLLNDKIDILKKYPPHRINISIHSALVNEGMSYEDYILKIFEFCNEINTSTDTALSLRVWNNQNKDTILNKKSLTVRKNLYLSIDNSFEWPDISSPYYNENGYCYGLISQLAILCDGTVTICCLDGNGIINLGNIFENDLADIINSQQAHNIIKGFQNRKVSEELCKHCSFKEKF